MRISIRTGTVMCAFSFFQINIFDFLLQKNQEKAGNAILISCLQ